MEAVWVTFDATGDARARAELFGKGVAYFDHYCVCSTAFNKRKNLCKIKKLGR